jgi:hypothetical protein
MGFRPPTIAQAIEVIVRHHADGVTEDEIAEAIFGPGGYRQRVQKDCAWLAKEGYIKKDGRGPAARYSGGRKGPPPGP